MFCKNCGTKVSDDTKFCPNCGTLLKKQAQPVQPAQPAQPTQPAQPVQQAMYQNPYGQQPIQQQFAGPVAKKPGFFKSHKKVMIPVAVVAVVAIAGGSVIAYFNTPERRYKRAQTAAIKESAANVAAIYDNYVNTGIDAKNFGTDISGRVDIGDEGKKYIAMANLSGMDFSKLDSAEVNAHVDAKDNVLCGSLGLKANDKDLLSVNPYFDMSDENNAKLYVATPGLSKKGMDFSGAELNEYVKELRKFLDKAYGEGTLSNENIAAIKKSLPSDKEVEKMASKYMSLAADQMKDVDSQKVTLDAEGVSQKATAFTVTMSDKDMASMITTYAKEIKNDKDLEKMTKKVLNAVIDATDSKESADDLYDEFIDEIVDSLEESAKYAKSESSKIKMTSTIYVKGIIGTEIIGRDSTVKSDGMTAKGTFIMPRQNNKWGMKYEYSLSDKSDIDTKVSMEGSGTGKDNALTGKLNVGYTSKTDDMDYKNFMTVSLQKFDLDSLKKGLPNGGIRFALGKDAMKYISANTSSDMATLLEDFSLGCNFTTRKNQAKVVISADAEKKNIANLTLSFKAGKAGLVKKPNASDYVDITTQDGATQWIPSLDMKGLISTLSDCGVSSMITDELTRIQGYVDSGDTNSAIMELGKLFGGRSSYSPSINQDYDTYDDYEDNDDYDDYDDYENTSLDDYDWDEDL